MTTSQRIAAFRDCPGFIEATAGCSLNPPTITIRDTHLDDARAWIADRGWLLLGYTRPLDWRVVLELTL